MEKTTKSTQWDKPKISKKAAKGKTPQYPVPVAVPSATKANANNAKRASSPPGRSNASATGASPPSGGSEAEPPAAARAKGASGGASGSKAAAAAAARPGGVGVAGGDSAGSDDADAATLGVLATPLPPGEAIAAFVIVMLLVECHALHIHDIH